MSGLAVDADHDALGSKPAAEHIDERGIVQSRGVDGNLVRPGVENPLGVLGTADAPGHAERDVECASDAPDPGAIDRAAFGTGRDVIEHELVRAFVPIARSKLEDAARDAMLAEADTLYDGAVAYVEAGDDASGKNARNSS